MFIVSTPSKNEPRSTYWLLKGINKHELWAKYHEVLPRDVGTCFLSEVPVDPVILVIDFLDLRQVVDVIDQVV